MNTPESKVPNSLKEIFFEAVERITPEERAAYLDRVCSGEPLLRQKVELLLAKHFRAGAFMDGPAVEERLAIESTENLGVMIGRYKLLKKIGEGGMGVVYLAEQREPVVRKVAVKVIKLGMDSRQVVARFAAERQALALMDHPNIAKVLDGGITESGRPFFVMDLVQGQPITRFCEQANLSIPDRVALFLDVCSAIHHAHQKGIIHRDIKPSNILVIVQDDKPVPKVIDFGVAKAIQGRLTDKTIFTQFEQFIGTPAYMSPEQAGEGDWDIDTRSDIYSLGVLLYEMLTGTTPFDQKELLQSGMDEMRKIIRERQPVRPSTRLTQNLATRRKGDSGRLEIANRKSEIPSDLDWVVMKCLEKDRSRRYETANGLAHDLQRHLKNEPVTARPPSQLYRFHRLVRRHRAASAAVALVMLAVLLGGMVSTWALLRERAARQQTKQSLDAALVFVDKMFNQVLPRIENLAGAATAQETLGQAGLEFVQRVRDRAGNDSELRTWLARVLIRLSEMQNPGNANTVGDYETGLKRGREAFEMLSAGHLTLNDSDRLALLAWAKWDVMLCLMALGRWDEAAATAREVDPLLEKQERLPECTRQARRDRMCVRHQVGEAVMRVGRPKEAIEQYFLPLLHSDWARTITDSSQDIEVEVIMNVNGSLALAYGLLHQFQEMIAPAEEAVRIGELLVERSPGHGKWPVSRAEWWALEGYAKVRTGQIDEGLTELKRARAEIESLVTKDPVNDLFRRYRSFLAAMQALAFAGSSSDASPGSTQRQQRLTQAETYLREAEEFSRAVKMKDLDLYLDAARAEINVAKTKLAPEHSAQP